MKTFLRITVLIGLELLIVSCLQSQQVYRHDGKYLLPNATLTPGAANPNLIADTTKKPHLVNGVEANICAKDFRTGPWRKVSESEKKKSCLEYGITKGCPGPGYELDHLCSLEFGCSDALSNIWPQPIAQARIKDHQVEDKLPKLICEGKISLKAAQKCAEDDWVKCMATIKKLDGN